MQAFIQDYVNPSTYPWQIPFLLAFLAGWLLGGAWLFRWSIRRFSPQPRLRFKHYVLIAFLTPLAGFAVGGALLFMVYAIGIRLGADWRVPAAIVGGIVSILVAFVTAYAMLNATLKQALRAGAVPLGAVFLLTAAVGVSCVLPALSIRHEGAAVFRCRENIGEIARALSAYKGDAQGLLPSSLQRLVDDPRFRSPIRPEMLACPAADPSSVGYFYLRTGRYGERIGEKRTIVLCDLKGNHAKARNIVFADGNYRPVWEQEFQDLLGLPENKEFAKALALAESQPRQPLPAAVPKPTPAPAPSTNEARPVPPFPAASAPAK